MIAPMQDAVRFDSVTKVTWTQLVHASGLTEAELTELVHYGALVPCDPSAAPLDVRVALAHRRAHRVAAAPRLRPRPPRRQRPAVVRRAHRVARGGAARVARAPGLASCKRAPGPRRRASTQRSRA